MRLRLQHSIFLVVLLSFAAHASNFTNEPTRLQHLLAVDRFQAYLARLAVVVAKGNRPDLAKTLSDLTPAEIDQFRIPEIRLEDVTQFDELAREVIKRKTPFATFEAAEVSWNYNFFKRKLGEVYRVQNTRIPYSEIQGNQSTQANLIRSELPAIDEEISSEHVSGLNVESYVSDRTTRGVFWEASESNRKIEFHVGSKKEFLENLASRNVKVIGEVKSYARNYNPIFLVQEPGQTDFHYAIAEISGLDRLKHLTTQSSIIRWKNANGHRSPMPPMEVFGDPRLTLKKEEGKLREILETIPKADKVVIGQKGAFERSFRVLEKRQALLALVRSNPTALSSIISEKSLKFLMKSANDSPTDFIAAAMKNASDWEAIYDLASSSLVEHRLPLLTSAAAFTVERGSYEFSDYILHDPNGKAQRWRIFSNSWGDEVLPVAKALKATGHTDIVYIGTAGALPESGLHVGDLVAPSKAIDENGVVRKLYSGVNPSNAKTGYTVAHVATPFDETAEWIKAQKSKTNLVEVETGHLASVFKGPKDKLRTFLLISDVVGSETESLAEAGSSVRKRAQINVMSSVLNESNVASVGNGQQALLRSPVEQWIEDLAPTRDPISKFQLIQKAHDLKIIDQAGIKALLASEKSFTAAKVEAALKSTERKLSEVLLRAEQNGIIPKLSVSKAFIEGVWNPVGPIAVHLNVNTDDDASKLAGILQELKNQDPILEKLLQVKIARGRPVEAFVRAPRNLNELTQVYKTTALRFGGLVSTENRSGALKFIRVDTKPSLTLEAGGLNYFAPDDATAKLLRRMKRDGNPEEVLKEEILRMNAQTSLNEPFKIRYSVVARLPSGTKAQISPTIGHDQLYIDLKFTQESLKNPAVVMEELIHLQQITGTALPWSSESNFKTFVHGYQWAETVANAKAGSIQANEKLARIEIEAANASEHAISYYRGENLFGTTDGAIIDDYLQKRVAHAGELYKTVERAAKADAKIREAAWQQNKHFLTDLEKDPLKLNDLVAMGDRKRVRALIEKYIPWPLLEPSEKNAWSVWLEAMEHPDPNLKRLVFRGLEDDLIMKTAEGAPYLMSPVLSHNQGNYTRRLRSLTTLRSKFGSHALRDFTSTLNLKIDSPSSISVMMNNHSIEPLGSPFLSVSDYRVAQNFGLMKMSALYIDERRLVPNAAALDMFLSESERLVPLIIFPDEIITYRDYEKNPVDEALKKEEIMADIESKIGRAPLESEMYSRLSSRDFLHDSFSKIKGLFLATEGEMEGGSAGGLPDNHCILPVLNSLFPLISKTP